MKYVVIEQEVCQWKRIVEANSPEEAKQKIEDGDYLDANSKVILQEFSLLSSDKTTKDIEEV